MTRDALLVRRGQPVETVLDVADQEGTDLIVVGSQARAALYFDSIANSIVQLAPRSVLVVRTMRGR